MTELLVAEEHSQLYDVWIERGDKDLALCHIDFHCDMRGLLIDRPFEKARFVWQHDPFMKRLDSGSFLTFAIMKGIVTSLRWVHDDFGGREYDDLYCVKYESDFSALPFRFAGKKSWVPITYSEQTFNEWGGPKAGETLSIDWDGIAFIDYEESHVRRLMDEFLQREFQPKSIFVARSPDYCHPNQALFNEFIERLESKFNTKATRLPHKKHHPLAFSLPWKIYHSIERVILRLMRRLGIY